MLARALKKIPPCTAASAFAKVELSHEAELAVREKLFGEGETAQDIYYQRQNSKTIWKNDTGIQREHQDHVLVRAVSGKCFTAKVITTVTPRFLPGANKSVQTEPVAIF